MNVAIFLSFLSSPCKGTVNVSRNSTTILPGIVKVNRSSKSQTHAEIPAIIVRCCHLDAVTTTDCFKQLRYRLLCDSLLPPSFFLSIFQLFCDLALLATVCPLHLFAFVKFVVFWNFLFLHHSIQRNNSKSLEKSIILDSQEAHNVSTA